MYLKNIIFLFECASCDIKFTQQGQLVAHMENHDDSIQMKSLVSQADDSSWKYVTCGECDGKFENEMDLEYHKERAHTYGEACTLGRVVERKVGNIIF